jgi:hypothetical protein
MQRFLSRSQISSKCRGRQYMYISK